MPVTRKLRRSRRAVQMREAQRRRRQRLKDQQQSFLQIILPSRLRDRLVTLSESTGVTLQEAALDILMGALAPEPVEFEEALREEFEAATRTQRSEGTERPAAVAPVEVSRPALTARVASAAPVDDTRQMRLF
jgi:hypothetical protein